MSAQKCVVEGCDLEYDVVCSFSFYNVNTTSEEDGKRQEWIEGAMQEDSECLWRHVSLQLCGYHFELDSQGLWIDSPMLPELLTVKEPPPAIEPTEEDKKRGGRAVGFQSLFEKFIQNRPKVAEIIKLDHNYSMERKKLPKPDVSRLNVRQLVDTLGYLSLKNLQRKQLWVVKVETDKAEASITQAEQVITKMADPKQIIEIIPSTTATTTTAPTESLPVIEETALPDTFIYEIAEEQEIGIDEVKEIPVQNKEWTVNIVPEETKPKYAYIKHCHTGKKRRHFTADMSEVTLQQGDFENYYILPDVDPSVGVEVTTSYEPERYLVEAAEYQHLLVEQRPKRRSAAAGKRKRGGKQAKQIQIKTEDGTDWVVEGETAYDQSQIDRKVSMVMLSGD